MKKILTAVVLAALLASAVRLWFSPPGGATAVDVPIVGTEVEAANVDADLAVPEVIAEPVRIAAEAPAPADVAIGAPNPENAPVAARPQQGTDAEPDKAPVAGTLEVTVLTPTGAPAEGAVVTVQDVAANRFSSRFSRRKNYGERLNAQGQVRIDSIPWGTVFATATLDGLATTASEPVKLSASQPSKSVRIQLQEGGAAEGSLRCVDGSPAAGIGISIHLRAWPEQRGSRTTSYLQQTTTEEGGQFRFEALPPGAYTLYTRAKDADLIRVPDQQVELNVFDGETTQVAFDEPSQNYVEVTGLVLRNGEPIPFARVNARFSDRRLNGPKRGTKADKEGRFKLILDEPGHYRFQISGGSASRGSAFHKETVPPGSTYDFVISLDTGTIAGHVYGGDGEPAANVALTAFGKSSGGGSTVTRAVSDAGGAFVFPSALEGTYKIQAGSAAHLGLTMPGSPKASVHPHLGGAELKDIRLRAGEQRTDVDVHLSVASALGGMVTDSEGDPVRSARVECWLVSTDSAVTQPGVHHLRAPRGQSDAEGAFLVGGLEPGAYRVRAVTPRQISPWEEVQLEADTTAETKLTVRPGTLLTVNVHTADPSEERIHVRISDSSGLTVGSTILKDGATTLGPLLPGVYQVNARMSGFDLKGDQQVTIAEGGEQTLTLTLQ